MKKWTLNSWRNYPVKHIPEYEDEKKLNMVLKKVSSFPPLVFAGETRSLKKSLAHVVEGSPERPRQGGAAVHPTDRVPGLPHHRRLRHHTAVGADLSRLGTSGSGGQADPGTQPEAFARHRPATGAQGRRRRCSTGQTRRDCRTALWHGASRRG